MNVSQSRLYLILMLALIPAAWLALSTGKAHVSVIQGLTDLWAGRESMHQLIVGEIRLPRLLLALCVGATLGLSGAALQGLLRNPLADPAMVGVSSCAALGAVIVLYFGVGADYWFSLPLGGLLGALASVFLVYVLAGRFASVLSLILAGVAINALASSLISLALNFSDNPYAMGELVQWLLGSVANRSLQDVAIALPFMVTGWMLLLSRGRFLDALTLGEETTRSLGFDLGKQRWVIILGVACCVGAAVSVSGSIGFIGLVIPHLIRPLVGHEPARTLGISALAGGLLLVCTDAMVQILSPVQELKLGVVTALLGAPFFLYLIYHRRNDLL